MKKFYYIGSDGKKHRITLKRACPEWVNFDCPCIYYEDGSEVLNTGTWGAFCWEIETWWMDSEEERETVAKMIINFIRKSDEAFIKKYGIGEGKLVRLVRWINGEEVAIDERGQITILSNH